MEQIMQKSSTETFMETGVVQVLRLLAPLRTRMRNSTPNNTWCKCFADEMWRCAWGTVVLRLLADTSMSGIECSSAHILMIHNAISLEEFNEEA